MAKNILQFPNDTELSDFLGKPKLPILHEDTELVDLIGPRSHTIFLITNTGSFLTKSPNKWELEDDFQSFLRIWVPFESYE